MRARKEGGPKERKEGRGRGGAIGKDDGWRKDKEARDNLQIEPLMTRIKPTKYKPTAKATKEWRA